MYFMLMGVACMAAILQVTALQCPLGREYWNSALDRCLTCTKCHELPPRGQHIVFRPCEIHRDTVCRPISELKLSLLWNEARKQPEHKTRVKQSNNKSAIDAGAGVVVDRVIWHFPNDDNLSNGRTINYDDIHSQSNRIHSSGHAYMDYDDRTPFNRMETFVWDWQIAVLSTAIVACLMFFLVAICYSVQQARQWRRLREHYENDLEQFSAKLNVLLLNGELNESFVDGKKEESGRDEHRIYVEQVFVQPENRVITQPIKVQTLPRMQRNANIYIESERNALRNVKSFT